MEGVDDHVHVHVALHDRAAIGAGDERVHHGAEERSARRATGRAREAVQRRDDAEALVIALGFLCGLGFGCVMPTIQVTVQTVAGRERLGVVTALNGLARSTGGAAGAALFGAVVFALIPGTDRGAILQGTVQMDVIVQAFHRAFLLASAVAATAAIVASRMPDTALWERHVDLPPGRATTS